MALKDAKDASAEDQAVVKELKERLGERRWLTERDWWGNILTLMGVQWITYDLNARRWRMRKLSPQVPTPVTNLFRSTIDTVKSVLSQHDPRFLATPERDDPHAVAAAAAADTTLQILLQEGRFRRTRRRMLDWLVNTGTAFIEPVFDDSDDTGQVKVPYERCQACGTESEPSAVNEDNPVCPACGSPLLEDSETQFVEMAQGQMRFDVKSPFEAFLDPAIEELEDQPILLFQESYTTEQVALRWNVRVDPDNAETTSSMGMKSTAANIGAPGAASAMASGSFRQNRVTVYRAFVKYHEKYPKGAYLCLTHAGKELERKTPYPWKRRKNGRMFYPPVMFRFATAPGRAWGYTPADDLRPKQYQLNKAESLMTMILSKMANPVWLIPLNSNPTRITGEVGIQIEYTPSGAVKPERLAGSDAPQSLVKYITDLRQSFDELSGAFSAIRGRAIGTRTPVGTTQALIDRGFGRWATVFDSMEEAYEDVAKNALELWRQSSGAPRVQALKNALGGWTFKEFSRADWDDGVDIQVEAGSTRPRTQQEKLQTYGQLIQSGLIDPTDHAQKIKILEDTGLANMLVGVEQDTQEAYRENAEFMAWATQLVEAVTSGMPGLDPMVVEKTNALLSTPPIMVQPLVDNHALHFLAHRRLCLSDEFRALPDAAQQVMFLHMMDHKFDIGQSSISGVPPLAQTGAGVGTQNPNAPQKSSRAPASSGAPVTQGT